VSDEMRYGVEIQYVPGPFPYHWRVSASSPRDSGSYWVVKSGMAETEKIALRLARRAAEEDRKSYAYGTKRVSL